jgi:hypothetical protein
VFFRRGYYLAVRGGANALELLAPQRRYYDNNFARAPSVKNERVVLVFGEFRPAGLLRMQWLVLLSWP